ncbi:hypothetical protein ACN4EK_09730 [Pantanalinema rosaneae CENA516]|uniref:hypothetical protein n=1 Tax=Pantanalinema rosaneae TaxID=1620701 RepID=UPI003D6EEC02
MTAEIALSNRRGFQFNELEMNTIGILLVKAPIDSVSPAIATEFGGSLDQNIWGQPCDPDHGWRSLIFQYKEHPWTIVLPIDVCLESQVSQFSGLLKTQCIYLQHEDTSSCSAYHLFDNGKCIEEFDWGDDYTEEFLEISASELPEYAEQMEAQGTPLPDQWNPKQWDIYITSGSYVGYKFRSEACPADITEAHLKETTLFLDSLLHRQDAWLPDYPYIPWGETIAAEAATADDFVRVDGIR